MNSIYYDLTAGQQLLLFSQTFTVHKQINNIFTLMLLEKKLDFPVLQSAVEYAYELNDAFRLRMTKVNGKIKQYFADKEKPDIGILDFRGKSKEEMDKQLHAYARIPFRILNRSLSRVFLIHSWDGTEGIYFGVSHLILDSWGICVFLQYVMEVYESMKNGAAMPKPLEPYEPQLQKELGYKDSLQYQKDVEFWQSEFKRLPEPHLSHINGQAILEKYRKRKRNPKLSYAVTSSLRTAARHEVLYIPREDVEKVQAYCEQNNISMQAAFIFGVRTALSKLNNRLDDIGIYATFARRGTLQEKRSGGSRVHSNVLRNIMPEDMTFEKACQIIFGQQTAIYRHADCDTVEIIMMEAKAYNRKGYFTGWHTLIFTFQPIKLVVSDGTPIHTEWYCNGAFSSPAYLTMMDADGTGALRCYYEYQKHVVKVQRIREFHSLMHQAVMAGVAKPSVTIGEILDSLDMTRMPQTELNGGYSTAKTDSQPVPAPVNPPDEKVAAADISSKVG